MKSLSLALALALVAIGGGATTLALATPAETDAACIEGPKDVVPCAMWAVKCIGDALGGNACVGPSTAAAAESPVVDCVKRAVRDIANGVTPMPCPVADASADANVDPKKVVSCIGYAVQQTIDNRPIEPCDVSEASSVETAGPDEVVNCAKKWVRDILQGTPQPCPI